MTIEAILNPSASLMCKLGSLAVHVNEMLSPDGHAFDKAAIQSILADPEVVELLVKMDKLALLPVVRKS